MNNYKAFKEILELDLQPIKTKLMHVESGEGWDQQKVDAVEAEYRRFLCLAKMHPDANLAPLVDVDTFWHYHILDTARYARDCEQMFGFFLHHYPYLGMGDEDDQQRRDTSIDQMGQLYQDVFGENYNQVAAKLRGDAFCAVGKQASAFCAAGKQESAFCAVGKHESAFCAAGKEASAFCAVSKEASAFCAVSKEASAFCAAGKQASAFCAAGKQESAFCAAGKQASAFCAAGKQASAFCAAGKQASAFCAAGKQESAFCAAGKQESAFCAAGKPQREDAALAAAVAA